MTAKSKNWKRVVAANVARLTPGQARELIHRHHDFGQIGSPIIRKLTGGYSSQAIDFWTIRKLAERMRTGF
jgi:hypothetical protein